MSDKPKVVSIRPGIADIPDDAGIFVSQETIDCLEALLERAKKGEVIGIAAALNHPGDYLSWDYTGHIVSFQIAGALEAVKLDILDELRDGDD